MITTIIILAYIANVFLNRWVNFKLWKIDNDCLREVYIWFIPIAPTIAFIILISDKNGFKGNWFTGKYWK